MRERNIAVCIILSIVTCGIYGLYWLYAMANDINELTGDNSASGAMVLVLSIITCSIYLWYWLYQAGKKIDAVKCARGQMSDNSGVLYLILAILGLSIVSYCLIQNELNHL